MIIPPILALGLIVLHAWATPNGLHKPEWVNHPSRSLPTAASTSTDKASAQLEQLAKVALDVANDKIVKTQTHQQRDGCTKRNLRVRQNWKAFSPREKKAYINSVLCLQRLPARTPSGLAPGAKTRYDDFVATHINQTLQIHYTACHPQVLLCIWSSWILTSTRVLS